MGPRLELKNQTRLYAGNSLPGALVTNGVSSASAAGHDGPGLPDIVSLCPFWSGYMGK